MMPKGAAAFCVMPRSNSLPTKVPRGSRTARWSDRQGCVVGAANDGFPYDARARSGPRAEGKKHAYTCWEPD